MLDLRILRANILKALVLLLVLLPPATGEAGWLFGNDSASERAGLDLSKGYDRNTVTTFTGRVAALPGANSDPLTMELTVGGNRLIVVLGPRWYLQDDDLNWKVGSSVSVRGSRAQGKDGRIYLIAQWISLPNGRQLTVRSDSGRALWSGGGQRGGSGLGGQRQQQRGGFRGGR